MKILITICARKGSKRVKNKNIREIRGKPLIAHTIKVAKSWGKADKIIVSTDSEEIAGISKQYGAEIPFIRPAELASDTSPKLPVIKHAVEYMKNYEGIEFDMVIDLDPTSPLRSVEDLENSYQKMINSKADNLFSVNLARKNPYFNMIELNNNGYARLCKPNNQISRMQDAPPVYEMNASIYIYWTNFLLKTDSVVGKNSITYEMPFERSIDIDSEIEFKLVDFLMK